MKHGIGTCTGVVERAFVPNGGKTKNKRRNVAAQEGPSPFSRVTCCLLVGVDTTYRRHCKRNDGAFLRGPRENTRRVFCRHRRMLQSTNARAIRSFTEPATQKEAMHTEDTSCYSEQWYEACNVYKSTRQRITTPFRGREVEPKIQRRGGGESSSSCTALQIDRKNIYSGVWPHNTRFRNPMAASEKTGRQIVTKPRTLSVRSPEKDPG